MLAADAAAVPSLLLCLLIAGNSVLCSSSDEPPPPEAVLSPREPRILMEKTDVPRSANATTLLRDKIDENAEDDAAAAAAAAVTMTTTTTTTTDLPGPISLESSSARSSMEFRPSVHIGEIHDYESRKSSAGPFNNVQHVKFENSVSIEDDTGRATLLLPSSPASAAAAAFHEGDGQKRNHRIKFVDTDSRYGSVGVPIEYYVPQQQQQQQYHPQNHHIVHDEDNDNNNGHENDNQGHLAPMMPMGGHEGHVVTLDYPMSHYAAEVVTARPLTLARPVYPALMTDSQMHLQQQHEPGVNNVRAIYAKPSKFHDEVATPMPLRIQHYEYVAATPVVAAGNEHALPLEKPEVPGHHRGTSYQLVPHQHADTLATLAKPDTVLVLSSHRETAYTRMRKFPYKFYHPEPVHQDHEYYYVPDHAPAAHGYPMKMRASPWKKIIHLIGAFLPLGLLLAALKPNVVQLDTQNSTQPNIVLSKLRDLPAEHKRGRLESATDNVRRQQDPTCEDKSICELIVSGSEPHANLLQNILWNLTNKSTDEEAKKHGLDEIFAAVKRKDCSSIDC